MKKVVIIGGGISGLVTAYYIKLLAREREENVEVLVLEKEATPGGKMKTFHEEGFIVEWGPNGFLTNKPDTLDLCDSLGIGRMLLASSDSSRKRYVFVDGELKKLPESPGEFFSSDILSVKGRVRVAMEPFIGARKNDEDESLSDFASRRLGKEAGERLIEPMAAGVYAGNPENMSLRSCFPLIYALENEHGGLVRGMMAKMWEKKKKGIKNGGGPAGPGGILMSFEEGVMSFIDEIVARGEFSFKRDCHAVRVDRMGDKTLAVEYLCGGEEKREEGDSVVVSTPAFCAEVLLRDMDGELSGYIGEIPYAPISLVALGYEKKGYEKVLDSFGFLVPRIEGRRVLGMLFDSSIFHNRAPKGCVLIRGMIGGARDPELALSSDDALLQVMREEVEDIIGMGKEPLFVRVYRHEKGIPQYPVGHPSRIRKIKERLRAVPGLFLNNNAYEGIGLNDCVKNSRISAKEVLAYLFGEGSS